MTNAPDSSLAAELDETSDWDPDHDDVTDDFVSGYADEPDPEDADPTTGAMPG